jgi:mono/diheme cytochrome c family protein
MTAWRTTISIAGLAAMVASFGMLQRAYGEDPPNDYQQRVARGAKAWAENCDRCHNMRAISELRAEEWKVAATHMRVRAGLPGQLAKDIIAFLTSSAGGGGGTRPAGTATVGGGAPDAAAGEAVFNGTCVACHGSNGAGAVPGVPNLRERLGKSDQTLINNVISGVQTGSMAMPPRGGNSNLTDADIANVIAFMKQKFK